MTINPVTEIAAAAVAPMIKSPKPLRSSPLPLRSSSLAQVAYKRAISDISPPSASESALSASSTDPTPILSPFGVQSLSPIDEDDFPTLRLPSNHTVQVRRRMNPPIPTGPKTPLGDVEFSYKSFMKCMVSYPGAAIIHLTEINRLTTKILDFLKAQEEEEDNPFDPDSLKEVKLREQLLSHLEKNLLKEDPPSEQTLDLLDTIICALFTETYELAFLGYDMSQTLRIQSSLEKIVEEYRNRFSVFLATAQKLTESIETLILNHQYSIYVSPECRERYNLVPALRRFESKQSLAQKTQSVPVLKRIIGCLEKELAYLKAAGFHLDSTQYFHDLMVNILEISE